MNMFNLGEHILYLANKNKGYIRNNQWFKDNNLE